MPAIQKRRDIKAGYDATDLRRRRADSSLSLRKQKKEQGLAKRRNTASSASAIASALQGSDAGDASAAESVLSAPSQRTFTPEDVPYLTAALKTSEGAARVEAVRGLRKVLSLEAEPPVSEVIQAGALPLLVLCLDEHSDTELQFEAAWALTNIASTSETRAVVDHGAVAPLVRNLRHHSPDLREQSAWCLGNIAGDCAELRDVALGTGDALEGLLLNVTQPATTSLLRNCVWAVSNMCRGKPQPSMDSVAPAIPVLEKLLSSDDPEVLVDTCWALSYLSDGDTDRIAWIMSSGVVNPLNNLLEHENCNVVTPALRTLGNFVTGDDSQTQGVLDVGVMSHLQNLLRHPKRNIRKETCWMLSNIVAGTSAQLALACDTPGVLASVIELLSSDVWDVQKEATFVVSNVATAGKASRIRQLVENGAIEALCPMLDRADAKVILVALEAISGILACDTEEQGLPWVQMVEDCGGLDRLEQLQEHENRFKVYDKAIQMIERFYGVEDDEVEDDDLVPTISNGASSFTFGMASASGTMDSMESHSSLTPSKNPSSCGLEMNSTPREAGGGHPVFGSPMRPLNLT
ncbi:unnamed protein product [Ascophyllum nodosum]